MIRPARPSDAQALATLQSYLDAPAPELLASFAAVGTCLVAVDESDDRPVGYLLVIDGEDAHIAELVVHPEHRREGHARALLEAAIGRSAPGTRVTLVVAADNDPARSLYESLGFREIEHRPEFYGAENGEATDAVVYAYDVGRDGAEP
ncbi:N-acetyltransferase [Halobellus sp. H-GB7]|uniref:GNAT family N-acetyltransferase n=1 Tax=Halobellus sp. H-GB7 TaxID=3069756 RepID=UPI0027B44741|nr:N-acetyltransferase [Halobellus sp. H-GB7]MDQ2056015.1 N-acetyltransferase [Halobellus sp. H-GB7]